MQPRKNRVELLHELRKVWDYKDFCLAISVMLKTDDEVAMMMKYLLDNPSIDSDSVYDKAFEIRDKYKKVI